MINKLKPVTLGKLLLEEILKPMGLSPSRLAREIGVPAQQISLVVAGKRAITADTTCGSAAFSAYPTNTGFALKSTTMPWSPNVASDQSCGKSSRGIRPPAFSPHSLKNRKSRSNI